MLLHLFLVTPAHENLQKIERAAERPLDRWPNGLTPGQPTPRAK